MDKGTTMVAAHSMRVVVPVGLHLRLVITSPCFQKAGVMEWKPLLMEQKSDPGEKASGKTSYCSDSLSGFS